MKVRLEIEGGVARIVLDRPERYNALTDEMKKEFLETLQAIRFDHNVRAVLLTGEGKAFCSGSDVGTMGQLDPLSGRERIQHAHDFILALANMEKPVIAAVRGPAVGIGWSLALACDIILASDTARFTQVFKKIGLAPDGGAIFFLTQYVGILRAKELVMSARTIDAEEAFCLGLVTEVVSDDKLDARAMEFANELAGSATFALAMAKRMFHGVTRPSLETFLELESHVQNLVLQSADFTEGVNAFMEKRPPKFIRR